MQTAYYISQQQLAESQKSDKSVKQALEDEKKSHIAAKETRDALLKELDQKKPCYEAGCDMRIGRMECYDRSKPRSSQYYCEEQAELIKIRNQKAHRGEFECDRHILIRMDLPSTFFVNRHKEVYGVGYVQRVPGKVLMEIVNARGTLAFCLFFFGPDNPERSHVNNLYKSAWVEGSKTLARHTTDLDCAHALDTNKKLKGIRDEMLPIMERVEGEFIASRYEKNK